jgi:transposase-like protein
MFPISYRDLELMLQDRGVEVDPTSIFRWIQTYAAELEQDHRRVKRLTGPGPGFGGFWTARRTLAGYEAMAMIRKGQVRNIAGRDIKAQGRFIASLFEVAA